MGIQFKSLVYQQTHTAGTYIEAKCAVNFRPKVGWDGMGYGFDWMRITDTGIFGDLAHYKDIISKQYKSNNKLEKDINEYGGRFDIDLSQYSRLKTVYGFLAIPWRTIVSTPLFDIYEEYFCSWLSLYPKKVKSIEFPPLNIPAFGSKPVGNTPAFKFVDKESGYKNTEAELRLYIDVEESPQYLKFEYDKEYFKITPEKITTDLGKGKRFWDGGNTIKIECLADFNEDQTINVFAYEKDKATGLDEKRLAGRMFVWANHAARRKKAKVLLVSVRTDITGSNENLGKTSGQQENIERFLRQALVELDVAYDEVDVTKDSKFKSGGSYIYNNKDIIQRYATGIKSFFFTPVQNYLYDRLKDKLKQNNSTSKNKYKDYFRIFFFDESGGKIQNDNLIGLGGNSIDENMVIFGSTTDSTVAHELLHSLKLMHSFTNEEADCYAKYTYKYAETENVMDYSHLVGQSCYALWKWQWEIANNNT